MTTSHTPGPWEIKEHQFDGLRVWGDRGTFVAQVGPGSEVRHANARLIAASPEMLEALKAVTDYYTMTDAQYREHYGCLLDGDAAEQHEQHVASARAIIERIERS